MHRQGGEGGAVTELGLHATRWRGSATNSSLSRLSLQMEEWRGQWCAFLEIESEKYNVATPVGAWVTKRVGQRKTTSHKVYISGIPRRMLVFHGGRALGWKAGAALKIPSEDITQLLSQMLKVYPYKRVVISDLYQEAKVTFL